jgi:GNAT superfamily N-acetyltransferase
MTEKYTFSFEESPVSDDVQVIRDGLNAYNLQFVPDAQYHPLNIFMRDSNGRVFGGLIGNTYWGWLYISLFWLDERARGDGNGRKMLRLAEQEALHRGCHHAHLDTLDFQAPAFYEKQGYCLWGTLNDLPVGHKRIFFWKELSASDG